MNKDRLQFLLEKQQRGALTSAEIKELTDWEMAVEQEEGLMDLYNESEQLHMKERVWSEIGKKAGEPAEVTVMRLRNLTQWYRRSNFLGYAAGIVLVAGALVLLMRKDSEQQKQITAHQALSPTSDVAAPASSHATITLANGQRISLENAASGTIAKQGDVSIQLTADGRILYSGKNGGASQYNTLSVPRGSKIASIVLSDGSKVFLNAASSLTYPVAFTGSERKVQITGEAYFEVAKDKSRKFIVTSGNVVTEVLGTHFNINTYPDEDDAKITLLEGSVKVSGGISAAVIRPGDQAAVAHGKMQVINGVDTDQVMSWKNGVFNFNNASCETVMRQLSRWYDIEIVYPEGIPAIQFGGEIQKTLSLTEMLEVLGEVGVKFEIENKKLIVMP